MSVPPTIIESMTDPMRTYLVENGASLRAGERPPLPEGRRWLMEPVTDPPRYGSVAGGNCGRRRRALGLSITEVADAIRVATWELERWEEGNGDALSLDGFLTLCIALGTSPAHMLMPASADHAKAGVFLPGGSIARDVRWAGSFFLWLGGTASLRRDGEHFPPSAVRDAVDAHGEECDPPWEWADLDECSFANWYDESGWD